MCNAASPSIALILTCVLSTSLPACAASRDANAAPPPPQRQRTPSASATDRDDTESDTPVPVVVHSRFDPAPLTDEQTDDILERAGNVAPTGIGVWFILLRNNRERNGVLRYAVTVFFEPDSTTARLRKGKYVRVDGLGDALRDCLCRALAAEGSPDGPMPSRQWCESWPPRASPLFDYCQVSRQETPFTDDRAVPDGSLLPFPAPDGFTDEETVDVVDFIRTDPKLPDPAPPVFSPSGRFDGRSPIIAIERQGSTIEVRCGVCEGLLSCRGTVLYLVRESDTLRIVTTGRWVS